MQPIDTYAESPERALVGSLLIDSGYAVRVRGLVPVEAFQDGRLAWVYAAILDLDAAGQPVDVVTVTNDLERRRQLSEIGGAAWVMDLINAVPTPVHAEHYARMVAAAWKKRDTIALAQRIVQAAMDGSAGDPLDNALVLISETRKRHGVADAGPQAMDAIIGDTLDKAGARSEARRAGTDVVVRTPFHEFNQHLAGGLMAGDVLTIIGEPGVGKSTFAHMCADAAAEHGRGVLAFITEMNRNQFAARQLASRSGVDSRTIRSGAMSGDQWAKVYRSAEIVSHPSFLVDDKTFDSLRFDERIQQATVALERIGKKLDLIVFDYLQLFKDSRRKDKRTEISDIINYIRELSSAYEVPVIVVSASSREGYKAGGKPSLYNAKESGDIEYATTIGLALWRDPMTGQVQAEIQKNRDGKAWVAFSLPPMLPGAAWYDLRSQAA